MKLRIKIFIAALSLLFCFSALMSKEKTQMPSVNVKNLQGEQVSSSTFANDGKPYIVCFWATWCKPCILEMNTYDENYEEWQKETGLKLFAISIDDTRSSKKVAPFVKGRGWKFDVLLDENSDFRKSMNVLNPPHTFIVNGKGQIVWEHTGYAQGDEEILLKEYKKIAEEEKTAK